MSKDVVKNPLFDLPMERKLELARRLGFDDYNGWVEYEIKIAKEMESHSANFQWGVRPDGYTEEDVKRFQAKIDSTHQ